MCGCGCIYNWHLVIIVILIMLSTLFMRKDNEKEAAADHSYQADVFSLIQAAISEIFSEIGNCYYPLFADIDIRDVEIVSDCLID